MKGVVILEKLIRRVFLYSLAIGLCFNIMSQSRYVKDPVEYDWFKIKYLPIGEFVFNIVQSSVIFAVTTTIVIVIVFTGYLLWKKKNPTSNK